MESIYGDKLARLEEVRAYLVNELKGLREDIKEKEGMDPVEHMLSRIKAEDSMREKCRRKGLPENSESALEHIYDAVGIRVVCAFVNDVYLIRDYIGGLKNVEIIEEKDYIRHVKPNGYRSLHLIIRVDKEVHAEIQLRTISMDTWAALEHHMKYKKEIKGNKELIEMELKRCADELASTDLSMQAIKDLVNA